jgi:hypothetical protein
LSFFPHEESASSSTHTKNLVNDAITSTHSSLSGQPLPFTVPNSTELFSQQPFHSTSLPLDARVPEKIKVKIWNEEFVDSDSLLSNLNPTTRYKINIRPSEMGQPVSLVLEPTAKSKRIPCIKYTVGLKKTEKERVPTCLLMNST